MPFAPPAVVVPIALPGGGPASTVSSAWAVQRNHDGTVSVYVSSHGITDPGQLQQTLYAVGVPAQVINSGKLCQVPAGMALTPIAPLKGFVPLTRPEKYTLTPAKMPRGSRLVISALIVPSSSPVPKRVSFEIVGYGKPVACPAPSR
ncbi:MAG TPA: hypothetical protein VGH27_15870 [Streptosporangiaceae bacterium]|jgi:hypothetical protein